MVSFASEANDPHSGHAALIEWFELYDRSAKIVSDPDSHRRVPIVDEHAANVAVAWQEIIRPLAAAWIESADSVGECIDLPGLAVAIGEKHKALPTPAASSIR